MEQLLRTTRGHEVSLGSEEELRAALSDIFEATGGSSGRGQFSFLFGLRPDDAMPADVASRLGQEAIEFKTFTGAHLRPQTVALLDRLAALAGE